MVWGLGAARARLAGGMMGCLARLSVVLYIVAQNNVGQSQTTHGSRHRTAFRQPRATRIRVTTTDGSCPDGRGRDRGTGQSTRPPADCGWQNRSGRILGLLPSGEARRVHGRSRRVAQLDVCRDGCASRRHRGVTLHRAFGNYPKFVLLALLPSPKEHSRWTTRRYSVRSPPLGTRRSAYHYVIALQPCARSLAVVLINLLRKPVAWLVFCNFETVFPVDTVFSVTSVGLKLTDSNRV